MSDLVPAGATPSGTAAVAVPAAALSMGGLQGGSLLDRARAFAAQEPVQRMLPWFLGVSALGGVALAWAALSPSPQRTLYAQLDDSERASVAAALDQAAISYDIDNRTGTLTVAESDFYRARMLVASDGALAAPQSGTELVDSLPMGASRMLEGERLRAAREHDLMLTIMQIDGVEAVRVHIAEGEKSVFVRDNVPPTASVMLRLARGRQISDSQVSAIVNLVAGSVPGLSPDAVRVADQHGRLLSDRGGADGDQLELQARMEEKLRTQVAQLLTPMLGQGNFTSEIQVELDMNEVTSARESYDKDGAVRSVTEAQSQSSGPGQAIGVPGVMSNTPPPAAEAEERPPEGTEQPGGQPPLMGESSSSRTYELGREVSVANTRPGQVKRLSVAVAISQKAMKGSKPADIEELQRLVSAAVGANQQRGDQIAVAVRSFEPVSEEAVPFYETPWFATLVRHGAALLAVLLVLLLGVRPLIKALRRDTRAKGKDSDDFEPDDEAVTSNELMPLEDEPATAAIARRPSPSDVLSEKVGLAQRLVAEKPDSALAALRLMLAEPDPEDEDDLEPQAEQAA